MSPKAASGAAEQRSNDDDSGTRGGRGRDGRLTGGSGPVDGAGHEAPLATLNPRTSVAGWLDGRRPELRERDSRVTTSADVWPCRYLFPAETVRPQRRRTELALVLGVVVNF